MNKKSFQARRRAAIVAAMTATVLLTACGGGGDGAPVAPTPAPAPAPPPAPSSVFAPAADDLLAQPSLYAYPEPSLAEMAIAYVQTPVSGPGNYIGKGGVCRPLDQPPADTYPGGMVTLDTVNLDTDKWAACKPEINVLVSIDNLVKTAARLRQRGASARAADQKSYRVKLGGASDWHGETTFQLNKHPYDLARVRNKLAFDLMREIPHHQSLRTQFVRMSYADAKGAASSMGLYTHVEKMGKDYLARRGWVAGSNVYKAEDFEFYADPRLAVNADGTAGPSFERVLSIESDSKNHGAIIRLVNALNDGRTEFSTLFNRHFNKNNYLAWFATVMLLGNYDTDTQNFGLYQPLGSEKFYFLPWDYDDALGYPQQPGVPPYPGWPLGIGKWWNNPLHQGFLRQPGNVDLLQAAALEIRQKYLTNATVKSRLDSYRALVEPVITSAPDVNDLPTDGADPRPAAQQWAAEYQHLTASIGMNLQHFLSSLENPMPVWLDVSTANGQTTLDWGWPRPFHPRGKAISYSLEVARVVADKTPFAADTMVRSDTNLVGLVKTLPALPNGDYFMRVIARDHDGHQTPGLDTYYGPNGLTLPGVLCVNVPTGKECLWSAAQKSARNRKAG